MILGLHCSIRGGYLSALDEASALGCKAMQMFSYRRHQEPSPGELRAFVSARPRASVGRLVIHVRYLPFLASPDPERREHSARLLARELRLSAALGAEALVLHAGAYASDEDLARGAKRIAEGVLRAVELSETRMLMLLENVPGGGRRMGGTLEELAELGRALTRPDLDIGFCLDTAHAWAAGYDLSSEEAMWKFVGQVHRTLGSGHVKAFHLNDTRALLGSHRENHWHWGQGHLGTGGLKLLLARPEYADVPGLLETPKGAAEDKANIALVRSLLP